MQLKTTIGLLIYIGISTSVQVKGLPQKNAAEKPPAQKEEEVRPGEGEAKFDIFDWHLAKITGITDENVENVVTSPISLKLVLATLFDGANSTTAEEIARAMGFDQNNRDGLRKSYNKVLKSLRTSSPHLISDVETRIFAHHTASLKKPFLDVLKSNYGTDIEKVDFSEVSKAIKKMNDWAEGVTHGHIRDLISEGDADKNAVMLLLNVIFFNGLWKLPFAENETKIEPFYLNDKQYVNAAMMKAQHSLEYVESFDFNVQIVRLPYRDGTFAMYIILPRSRSGVNDLIANVTPERIHTLMRGMAPTNVELSIPKFDFSYSVGLKPVLQSLGIQQMFTTTADFSNMEENNSLYVSNVIQKAGIEINEKGSTAYASTVVEIHNKYGGEEEEKVRFNANRPFLFFIEEDKTRTVLFVGKMTNPSSDTPPAPALPPSFEVNQQTPLFLQGGLPSDRNGDIYPSEIERMAFFDAEILDEVCDKTEGNVVISPASIKSVLGLLLNGATGKSASEIQQTLRLPENQDSAKEQIQYIQNTMRNASSNGVTLKTANALFLAKELKLKEDYKQAALANYNAPVLSVDFKYPQTSVRTINNWVNDATNGAIPAIIKAGALKPDSSLVIVNAIYYKANWLTRFELAETSVRPFHKTANQISYTPMMHTTNFLKHSYVPSLQAQVVQIPYQDSKHHMVIVLPKKKDGISEVTRDMKHNTLLRILAQQEASEVILQLPRFTIEFDTDIVPGLQNLRTREIFSDKAHLQNIADGSKKLKVDSVVHKARIEVNEKGTYAAAVTEAGLVPLSTPQQVTFTADHPFLFYIYNSQTGIFLFEGRVSQPEEATKAQYEQSLKKVDNKNAVIDRTKPNYDIRTQTANQNAANNRLPTNQNAGNLPNVIQSEPLQPNVVVTQRSTSINPGGNFNYNYQQFPTPPQKNVVVQPPVQPGSQPQNPTGQPHTTSFQTQTNQKQAGVYTQPGLIPGTSQQIFYSSSSSSASSTHTSTSSESKNTHSAAFSFTRYPTGVNGPYQPSNTTDMHAIRFQI